MTQETINPIIFAPAGFRWAGEIAEGLPIVSEPGGSVCEPLLRFFGWSFRMRRVKISSMRDEAYTLREWWSHLRTCGISWEQASDQTMIVWREALKRPADGSKAASSERINRKLAIVFEFYLSAKQALLTPYDMVGPDLAITPRRDDPTRWSSSEKTRRNTVRRKTPDLEAVRMVLTYLRNTAVNPALKDRNWLIGRTMADAGLRRDESSRLGRRMILDAIFKEGIRPKDNAAVRTLDEHLDALQALDRLEARSRTNIYVRVVGKGDVVREAPFPIALVRDLLTILDKPTGKRNQDWLFVSGKTGARLSAEAIGNMILDAFDACGIDGSGHRLRAHFATKLAERLWAEEFANNGFRWDQRVENLVLDRVAEALGHASPTTSCRHYLDLGRMAYFRVDTKSALKAMRSAVSAMADNHRKLPTEFFDRIRMLLERRASGVSALDDIIDAILADSDYEAPLEPIPTVRSQPQLMIVGSSEKNLGGSRSAGIAAT